MKLTEKILLEFEMDILDNKIKNPETGRNIKVSSALSYDPSTAVYKKAHELVSGRGATPPTPKEKKAPVPASGKGDKSHKPKSKSYGISKECVELLKARGFKGLNAYPQAFVKPEQMQFNPALKDGNKDSVWIVKFPVIIPKTGEQTLKTAYTAGFMKKSQVKKYKKISKIKEEDIVKLDANTTKLLGAKDKKVRDSACVLRIILKTGLRIGSKDPLGMDATEEEKKLDNGSGNLGVRTLSKNNITIKGNKVKLDFIGKSYQENIAEFEDAPTAQYLSQLLEGKLPNERVFDCSYGEVSKVMDKINPKGINPKDLRTYKATQVAKAMLEDKKYGPPPPLPKNPKEIKKEVREKLKKVFISVSELLNNSPAMARNSYVHPVVITNFLHKLGLKPKEVGYKHVTISESVQKDEYLYHGTSKGALSRIISNGLKAGVNAPNSSLYLTNDETYAKTYAERKGGGDRSIMLRVKKTPDMEIDNNVVNKKDSSDFKTKRTITPDEIEVKVKGKWTPLSDYNLYESVSFNEAKEPQINFGSMDEMFEKFADYGEGVDYSDISDEDSDDCEEYPLPIWFFSDDWDLVPENETNVLKI